MQLLIFYRFHLTRIRSFTEMKINVEQWVYELKIVKAIMWVRVTKKQSFYCLLHIYCSYDLSRILSAQKALCTTSESSQSCLFFTVMVVINLCFHYSLRKLFITTLSMSLLWSLKV